MRRLNILFFAGNLVLLAVIGFYAFPTAQAQNSAVEDNIAHSEQYINDVWNRENPSSVRELFPLPFTFHLAFDGPTQISLETGSAYIRREIDNLNRAFPDFQVTVDNIIANDEFAVIQYTFRGTYENSLNPGLTPFPASGEEVVWDGVFIHRFEEGRVAEMWRYWDNHTIVGETLPQKILALEAAE